MKTDIKELYAAESEMATLNAISENLCWDQYTIMPKAATNGRAKAMEYMAELSYQKYTDKKYIALLKKLSTMKLSTRDSALVRIRLKDLNKILKLPLDFLKKQESTKVKSILAWEKARDNNDFTYFAPHLQKLINNQIQEAKYVGEDPYEYAVSCFDETLKVNEIETLLEELKEGLLPLIKKVSKAKNRPKYSLPKTPFDERKQEQLSKYLLELIGIDFTRAITGRTTHPFQLSIDYNDHRIGLAYRDNPFFGLGTTMHEGGHCLYQQNIPSHLYNSCLSDAPSMSLHESQSRFYETFIGQNYAFVKLIYQDVQQIFFDELRTISAGQFFESLNVVKPSLIRIEADELTYCMHIIIRFELEKVLLNKSLKVLDLPEEWAKLYKKYLGVRPTNMKNGVLQDMHWGDGSFGYFPSYALGNVLAGMFYELVFDFPFGIILTPKKMIYIKDKLNLLLHRHGSVYKPKDMVTKIFKKDITAKPYLAYLSDKYVG